MIQKPVITPAPGPRAVLDTDQRISAIDIGSNSIRQIIADVSPTGTIRVLDELKAMPRLGAGVTKSGAMNDIAIGQALEALSRMATLAKQFGVQRVEAVATSAVRDASNSKLFLQQVRKATGLRIRVLGGEEEAMLAFRSAIAHFELGSGRAVVMDIGGGSLELALAADGLLERLASLPYGVIRLTERYLGSEPRHRDVDKLRKEIRAGLRKALPVRDWRGATVIGSGGTFTNLASIYLARRGMTEARSVQGTRIPRPDILHILDWLSALPSAERAAVAGLNPARADIIVAGLAVIAEVLSRLEATGVTVSAFGIREGLLLDIAHVQPAVSDPGEARARSVLEFAHRCHYEEPHARQVQRLALQLFDAIGKRLGAEPGDRQILADAALLHDVGYHISYDKHHKHSYHLIAHAELLGMSPEERVTVAHVARYHRGAPPKQKHDAFAALNHDVRERIVRLSAILRFADGFDRGHISAVDQLRVRWGPRAVRVTATPRKGAHSLRLELWGANRKSELLAKLAGMPVEVMQPDGTPVVAAEEQTVGEDR